MKTQELYDLLPAIYRLRDAENDMALKAYLSLFAQQVSVLQENIHQLYDDQFIETCAEWLVPYRGDLIAYKPLHNILASSLSQRAEVANTLAYRRRKGTASMLEQLARDVSGWPARVVEYFELLATSQFMNHPRLHSQLTVNLRDREKLEYINSGFDQLAHTVDVRHIDTDMGKHNIRNIGIHLWRIKSYSITEQSPTQSMIVTGRKYYFSPLRQDMALFNKPEAETEITAIARPDNIPMPLTRRRLSEPFLNAKGHVVYIPKEKYYGKGKSLLISKSEPAGSDNWQEQVRENIRICCLSDESGAWINLPENETNSLGEPLDIIVIDPETGRFAITPHMHSRGLDYRVSYHYGFSHELGGGEYERAQNLPPLSASDQTLEHGQDLQTALNALNGKGTLEIQTSSIYSTHLSLEVSSGERLMLRAMNERRPVIKLLSDLEISDDASSADKAHVILDGLLISGGQIRIPATVNNIGQLTLRHCTLVPGLEHDEQGQAVHAGTPSLVVACDDITIHIENCILGGLQVHEGAEVQIHNSIIDATSKAGVAYSATDSSSAGAPLQVENSTLIGKVHTRIMRLASNSIFEAELSAGDTWDSPVIAERKQQGCVRFCSLPLGSGLPRRYRCQPEMAIALALKQAKEEQGGLLSALQKAELSRLTENRLSVMFNSQHYANPEYMQLHEMTAKEILMGADDESEMGVLHDLYQPQRIANLKIRLREYLRFGLEAGIFYES